MATNKTTPINFEIFPYREHEEVFLTNNVSLFQDLNNLILMELLQSRKPIQVSVRFYKEETP